MKDVDYIKSKLRHLKYIGINAALNPETGAVQPDWAKAEAEERRSTQARTLKRRAEKEKAWYE